MKTKSVPKKTKKLTPLPKMLEKCQFVVNKFIRERDKELGCICCGGNVEHAGHYFSRGSFSALRFDELNIAGCCYRCNVPLHGNLIMFRIGLVERHGEDVVKELEDRAIKNRLHKWERSELENIIQKYKV